MPPTTSAELLLPIDAAVDRMVERGATRTNSHEDRRSDSRPSAAVAAREALMKYRVSQAYEEHLLHPWAGGWRCWVCPLWSERRPKGRCAAPVEVSLSYVPNSLRRRSIRRKRGAE